MYAVIETGGKQYKVAPDQTIRIEKLEGEPGSDVSFDRVLMVANGDDVTVGTPVVDGATVSGTIAEQIRGDKIVVFHKRRRKDSKKKQGHRQSLTVVKVNTISA